MTKIRLCNPQKAGLEADRDNNAKNEHGINSFWLSPGTCDETSDLRIAVCVLVWPHDSTAEFVWYVQHGVVGDNDPLAFNANAVMAAFGVPIDIFQRCAIGKAAAHSALALEAIKPGFQGILRIPPVKVAGMGKVRHGKREQYRKHKRQG